MQVSIRSTGPIQLRYYNPLIPTDYYLSLADKILGEDKKSLKDKKNDVPAPDADTEDPLEVEKTVEAAQLTLAKVLTYQMPEYNELEIVGKCRWKVLYWIKRYFQNTSNSNLNFKRCFCHFHTFKYS